MRISGWKFRFMILYIFEGYISKLPMFKNPENMNLSIYFNLWCTFCTQICSLKSLFLKTGKLGPRPKETIPCIFLQLHFVSFQYKVYGDLTLFLNIIIKSVLAVYVALISQANSYFYPYRQNKSFLFIQIFQENFGCTDLSRWP